MRANYNKTLEDILERKEFSEETKSLLLSMLYKIETNYEDYQRVKREVEGKREFIERILVNVAYMRNLELTNKEKNEENILRRVSAGGEEFLVEDNYIYGQSISYVLKIGSVIQSEEIIRNFTGWSWDNKDKEEHKEEDIIYQDLLWLVGSQFLNVWRNDIEPDKDYILLLKNKIINNYGEELGEKLFHATIVSMTQIAINGNNTIKGIFVKRIHEIKEKLKQIENKEGLIEKLNKEKKQLYKKLDQLDVIINDSKLMEEEYQKDKDKNLRKEHFEWNLKAKRIRTMEKIKENNELLAPKKHIELEKKLKTQLYPLNETEEIGRASCRERV